jgi:hypothetical protein
MEIMNRAESMIDDWKVLGAFSQHPHPPHILIHTGLLSVAFTFTLDIEELYKSVGVSRGIWWF